MMSRTKAGLVFVLAGSFLLIAVPSEAGLSAALARKCRAMAIDAHPTQLFGMNDSATPQRECFNACVARNGNMQDDQTTGSGPSENR